MAAPSFTGADGLPHDAGGPNRREGLAPAQIATLAAPPVVGQACPGVPEHGCDLLALHGVSAREVAAFEGRSGITTISANADAALSRPHNEYSSATIDSASGESILTAVVTGLPATASAQPIDVQMLVLVPKSGEAMPSLPLDQEPLSLAPKLSAVLSRGALSLHDPRDGQIAVALSTSGGLGPAGGSAAGLTAASLPMEQVQRDLPVAAIVSPAAREETALGRAIHSAMPNDRASGVRDAVFFEVTGEGAAISSALKVPRLIQLRSLIEALRDRFDPAELRRMTASRAADVFVPINILETAGIAVNGGFAGVELSTDQLVSNLATSQPVSAPYAGSGGNRETGGFGDIGLKKSLAATASAGFDSNPFLAQGENPESVSLRLQLAPTLARSSERGTFRLTGRLENIEYLGQYASLQNFGADLAASRKLSERLDVDGGLTFRSDVLATNLGNPFNDVDQGTGNPAPPTGNDVTILGQGQRRTQYGLDGGLAYDLSEREQIRWSVSARADRFGSSNLVDSNFVSQSLQYSRRLGEDFTIGAAVNASVIDFTGSGLDGAQTVSPQLQFNAALTPLLTLSASLGVAVTRLEFNGLQETATALSGDASLCRRGERSSLCVNGSRQVLPAAIGGALLQTAAGVTYSLKLSERDTVQLSGNYATASQPIAATVGDFKSINGSARYERQLNERMRLFVSGGVLNTAGNLPTNVSNFQGLIGITMNFGQTR
ncbi:hypothetical protein QUA31_25045 [Microcoleus sp. Pol14D5]